MTLKNKLKAYAMDNHYKKYADINAKNLESICLMFTSDFSEWLAYNAYQRWTNGRWYNTFTYQDEDSSFTTIELIYKFKIEKKL